MCLCVYVCVLASHTHPNRPTRRCRLHTHRYLGIGDDFDYFDDSMAAKAAVKAAKAK